MAHQDKPRQEQAPEITASVAPDQMDRLPRMPFWSTLWQFARPYRRQLLKAVVCATLVGIAVPLQMQFTVKWIIDHALEAVAASGEAAQVDARMRAALGFVALFVALSAFRISVWVLGYRGMLASNEGILFRIRAHFFRHVQRMCFRFHDQVSSGELFNYIMGSPLNYLKQFLHQFCMGLPSQLAGWVFSVGLLSTFNWQMTLITVAIVVVVVLMNFRSRVRIREVSDTFMRTESEASRYIADMLRGSRAIKTYSMESSINNLYTQQIEQIREQGYRLAVRQQVEHIKPECVQYAGLAMILASGSFFVIYRGMTTGTFAAFVLSFNMLMQPILLLLQLNLIRANAEAGLDRIVRVMQVSESTPEPSVAYPVAAQVQADSVRGMPEAGILFEHVSFSYDQGQPILRDVACHIRDGESVALVGPSGSGKSTFVSMLMRFYDPQEGRILVNGIDVRAYRLRELRSMFGVVPQDPFIFQATLRDNLCVTNPEATPEQVETALEAACLAEHVASLPDGLQTWLGEGGANLSGGQRQRLAIARAILAGPRYFIFDEATSALDSVSERRIQAALDQLMRQHTTIIIAHRLSTIRHVNRILVFDGGRIVQSGSYDELAGKPGVFADLLTAAA